jgi:hypothetical protein
MGRDVRISDSSAHVCRLADERNAPSDKSSAPTDVLGGRFECDEQQASQRVDVDLPHAKDHLIAPKVNRQAMVSRVEHAFQGGQKILREESRLAGITRSSHH